MDQWQYSAWIFWDSLRMKVVMPHRWERGFDCLRRAPVTRRKWAGSSSTKYGKSIEDDLRFLFIALTISAIHGWDLDTKKSHFKRTSKSFFLQFNDSYLKRQSVESHLLWLACTSSVLNLHHTFLYHCLFICHGSTVKSDREKPPKGWPTPVQEMFKGTNRIVVPTLCWQGLREAHRSKTCTS